MWQHSRILSATFIKDAWDSTSLERQEFYQLPDGYLYENLIQGYGILDWASQIKLPTVVEPRYLLEEVGGDVVVIESPGYRGEVYLSDGRGSAVVRRITFNTVEFDVDTTGPETVTVNQNYDAGWRSSHGQVTDSAGLLAVNLNQPFRGRIRLKYRPPGVFWATAISILSVVLMAVFILVGAEGIQKFVQRNGRRGSSPTER